MKIAVVTNKRFRDYIFGIFDAHRDEGVEIICFPTGRGWMGSDS